MISAIRLLGEPKYRGDPLGTLVFHGRSDDPKFVFANGQVRTYTKTCKLRPMQGTTDNIYVGSPTFGKPDWPVAPKTNFTGSVEFTGSKPFYYYFLRETEVGDRHPLLRRAQRIWRAAARVHTVKVRCFMIH